MKKKETQINWYIGIDVSSATLDVSVCVNGQERDPAHKRLANDSNGFKEMLDWLKSLAVEAKRSWFCMEYTGVYSLELSTFLAKKKLKHTMYSPLHIKRMMGVVRGKNDKADSRVIARFAYLYRDSLKESKMASGTLITLKTLINFRHSVVRRRAELKADLHRVKRLGRVADVSYTMKGIQREIEFLKAEVKRVQLQITKIIEKDELVKINYELACSVPGVGMVVAASIVAQTRNFEAFDTARQLVCYVGSAPFEYSSGTSIKGKTKTHPIANRHLKALLTNSALSALKYDKEIKTYYDRKTGEGKAPMSVINAIRCKQIYRIFSVVKRGTPFVKIT
jgi:transposase